MVFKILFRIFFQYKTSFRCVFSKHAKKNKVKIYKSENYIYKKIFIIASVFFFAFFLLFCLQFNCKNCFFFLFFRFYDREDN